MDDIEQLIERSLSTMVGINGKGGLYEPIDYILQDGGKRMRPRLTLLAGEVFGGSVAQTMPSALAVEVFHNFTLLHDDIMDNASTRRGRPTVHTKWDSNRAILSGDAMMILSYQILSQSEPEHLLELLSIFNKAAIEVCQGQQLDMEFESRRVVDMDSYFGMIHLKTAVLMAGALQMGAVAAGAEKRHSELIYKFGKNLGLAFQIQDDLLDTYGNSITFGKQIGGDIAEGKQTFLKVYAMAKATDEERKTLIESRDFDTIKTLYDKYGVVQAAQGVINNHFEVAVEHLVAIDNKRTAKLQQYGNTLLNRQK